MATEMDLGNSFTKLILPQKSYPVMNGQFGLDLLFHQSLS